jgi:glutaredoxin-related protein
MANPLNEMADRVRVLVHGVLSSEGGERYRAVKLLREVLGTANDLAGRPFCSAEELAARRERAHPTVAVAPARREPAPVMLYFDGKDHRSKTKLEELLRSRDIPFKVLDCTDDEATRSWALAAAKLPEFPLLFIAGEAVGGLHEATQLDVNGGLARRVFG